MVPSAPIAGATFPATLETFTATLETFVAALEMSLTTFSIDRRGLDFDDTAVVC